MSSMLLEPINLSYKKQQQQQQTTRKKNNNILCLHTTQKNPISIIVYTVIKLIILRESNLRSLFICH